MIYTKTNQIQLFMVHNCEETHIHNRYYGNKSNVHTIPK